MIARFLVGDDILHTSSFSVAALAVGPPLAAFKITT